MESLQYLGEGGGVIAATVVGVVRVADSMYYNRCSEAVVFVLCGVLHCLREMLGPCKTIDGLGLFQANRSTVA